MNYKCSIDVFIQLFKEKGNDSSVVNWCPRCKAKWGTTLRENWFHDMKEHPDYFEAMTGIKPSELLARIQ